jgi:hypothetical protein
LNFVGVALPQAILNWYKFLFLIKVMITKEVLIMPKPRYDENTDKSRHAAADEDCCQEMAEKYGWKLVDVEKTGNDILSVDCVFEGKTEFPTSYYHTDEEKYHA